MKKLNVLIFAVLMSCSGPHTPDEKSLIAFLASIDPTTVNVTSVKVSYSPMYQIAGTTLPSGSLIGSCKASARLIQDLYLQLTPGVLIPSQASPEAKLIANLQGQLIGATNVIMAKYGPWFQRQDVSDMYNSLNKQPIVLCRSAHAGDSIEFTASIVAIPQVDSWKFIAVDSDWSAIKQKLGSERGAFGQLDALVGRPEWH